LPEIGEHDHALPMKQTYSRFGRETDSSLYRVPCQNGVIIS
jgi:hypothetical protein